jgi:hypothetical protein
VGSPAAGQCDRAVDRSRRGRCAWVFSQHRRGLKQDLGDRNRPWRSAGSRNCDTGVFRIEARYLSASMRSSANLTEMGAVAFGWWVLPTRSTAPVPASMPGVPRAASEQSMPAASDSIFPDTAVKAARHTAWLSIDRLFRTAGDHGFGSPAVGAAASGRSPALRARVSLMATTTGRPAMAPPNSSVTGSGVQRLSISRAAA